MDHFDHNPFDGFDDYTPHDGYKKDDSYEWPMVFIIISLLACCLILVIYYVTGHLT